MFVSRDAGVKLCDLLLIYIRFISINTGLQLLWYVFLSLQVLKGEQIKSQFEELRVHFEQALGDVSYHDFDISVEVKEQVNVYIFTLFFLLLDKTSLPWSNSSTQNVRFYAS